MSGDIADQLNNLLSNNDDPLEGDVVGSGETVSSREFQPLTVEEKPSEFRSNETDVAEDIINDYLNARDMMYTLLGESSKALKASMDLAAETDAPRMYQIIRELLETSREITKDIMGLQKTYKDIKKIEKSNSPNNGGDEEEDSATGKLMSTSDLQGYIDDFLVGKDSEN